MFRSGAPENIVEVIGLIILTPHNPEWREVCRNEGIIYQVGFKNIEEDRLSCPFEA